VGSGIPHMLEGFPTVCAHDRRNILAPLQRGSACCALGNAHMVQLQTTLTVCAAALTVCVADFGPWGARAWQTCSSTAPNGQRRREERRHFPPLYCWTKMAVLLLEWCEIKNELLLAWETAKAMASFSVLS
jgi:hypothetical protein